MIDNSHVFQTIDRTNALDSIIEQFQRALMRGELHPGQRLPSEMELCKQLGVGRSTVREALKALAAIGVVEVRRGGGTYISEHITPGAILPFLFAILVESENPSDVSEFRFVFDGGYTKLAALKADEQDFANIEQQIQRMEQYNASGGRDPEVLAQLDLDFHVAVMEATKNPLIVKVGQLLRAMLFEVIKKNMAALGAAEWTAQRHRILLTVLKSREPSKVDEAITASSSGLRKLIQQHEDAQALSNGTAASLPLQQASTD